MASTLSVILEILDWSRIRLPSEIRKGILLGKINITVSLGREGSKAFIPSNYKQCSSFCSFFK